MNEIASAAIQSVAEAPIKHATSALAFTTGATVETASSIMAWVANGTIVMSFFATTLLVMHTLLKIRSQIRGE
jgi:hypothetical protein